MILRLSPPAPVGRSNRSHHALNQGDSRNPLTVLLHVAFGGHRWDAWLALGWASRKMEKTVQASALSSKCPLGRDGGHFGQLYSPPFPTLSLPFPDLNRVMSYDPARSVLRLTDAQELRLPAWPLVTPTRPLGGCVLSK